jgi:glycosyltransferase involved in cell wall biosynthesis
MSSGPRINYLCLQATEEGQASYAHVHEIVNGLRKLGCEVNLTEVKPFPPGTTIAKRFRTLQQIQTEFKKLPRPDLIYMRGHFLGLPTAHWAKRNCIPHIQEINGPYEDTFLAYPILRKIAPIVRWETRYCFALADSLITVTPQLVDWLKTETKKKEVYEIPNGANTEIFKPGTPLEMEVPERYVVFFGALAPWQGVETMIAATNDPAWPSDVYLLLAGDGVEAPKAREAARSNPLIKPLGKVPYRKLPAVVSNSIAGLCVTNPRQGSGLSPLKLYETLACGVPVIASNVQPMEQFVRDFDVGMVVPRDKPKALAEAVRDLASNPARRQELGAKGRAAIVARHSWERRALDTFNIIQRMLSARP